MIRINLLPEGEKKGKARSKPGPGASAPQRGGGGGGGGGGNAVAFLMLIVLLGAAAGIFMWSKGQVDAAAKKHDEKQAQLNDLLKKIDSLNEEAKEIQRLNQQFANQLVVLNALDPPKRILWSEKLNMIAKLMPKEVFLSKIEVTEKVTEQVLKSSEEAMKAWEKQPPQTRGPKPEILKKPVISYTMKVTGLTTGEDSTEQLNNMDRFLQAMQNYKNPGKDGERRFMDGIADISFDGFETVLFEQQYSVGQFSYIIATESVTGEEEEPPPPPRTKTAAAGSGAQ